MVSWLASLLTAIQRSETDRAIIHNLRFLDSDAMLLLRFDPPDVLVERASSIPEFGKVKDSDRGIR